MPPSTAPGSLFVVATPIGNLDDLTPRAADTLRRVDLIVAEDTRHSRKLLAAKEIRGRLTSLHARSGPAKVEVVIERLLAGDDVAYVTDAGSPSVSDPGTDLVDAARARGVSVFAVPGPSALTAALSVCGLHAADFRFVGFLPRAATRRAELFREVARAGYALVCYESPRRIRGLLESIEQVLPDRRVALCRELTKMHEEVRRGRAADLLRDLPASPRGEFTVVVESGLALDVREPPADEALLRRAKELRAEGLSTSEAARAVADAEGVPKRRVYRLIVEDER